MHEQLEAGGEWDAEEQVSVRAHVEELAGRNPGADESEDLNPAPNKTGLWESSRSPHLSSSTRVLACRYRYLLLPTAKGSMSLRGGFAMLRSGFAMPSKRVLLCQV